MKLHRIAAHAAIILVTSTAIPGIAHAGVDPIYGTDPVLDQACSDLQKPADSSGFVSFADNIQPTGSNSVTETLGLISVTGSGTPQTTWSGFNNAHVNGQSVNIHAYGTVSVVYPASIETYETKVTTTTTRSSTCHVHKLDAGAPQDSPHPGYSIAPSGLQTTQAVTATDTVVTYGTTDVTVTGPWTDPNASSTGDQVVICISPGKKPGNWRNQNGYDDSLGICSRAWYDTLGSTPSVSLPAT